MLQTIAIRKATGYPGARTLVVVERQRQPTRATTPAQETSYYLSSHAPDEITPERMGQMIRGHWSAVENNTHWHRDHLMTAAQLTRKRANQHTALQATQAFFQIEPA